MSWPPVIGIPTQTMPAIPGETPDCWVVGQRYVQVLVAAGAIPWLIPLLSTDAALRTIFDRLDGLLLTGGSDVDPGCYGEERRPACGRIDRDRDRVELTLLRWAFEECKPVFAICRGMQLLNVVRGGTLHQDLASERPDGARHNYGAPAEGYHRDSLVHAIRAERGSRLRDILGGEHIEVNSLHHQGVKALAPGLRPTAFAADGLIEGVEAADGSYVIGVQWHPEELADSHAPHRRLFDDFVAAARRRRA
jgi:putative glutamine amidotransferase